MSKVIQVLRFFRYSRKWKIYFLVVLICAVSFLNIDSQWMIKTIFPLELATESSTSTSSTSKTTLKMKLTEENFLPHYLKADPLLLPLNLSVPVTERKFIACFVTSTPQQKQRRDLIRQTWGKLIKPLFVMGQTDIQTMIYLGQEAHEFNDIIVENFADTYFNLTIKTAFAVQNFVRYFKDSKYFLKIDDDIFLDVKGYIKYIKTAPKDALIGQQHGNPIIVREEGSRYYVPEYLLNGTHFPDFLQGAAYLIPGKMLFKLINCC